ncbi:hypothetical protein M8C21_017192 [Ambrosia artemisiifolia]|uniref:Uncharacterized protein n=1 Tax=Ambrosia artemisiifolia TaxID=4212 RepID=A0AAD5BVD7_AMBAR|nr:hypothetical protein M8C21_017192 [Ambrosia artemisiifolia]
MECERNGTIAKCTTHLCVHFSSVEVCGAALHVCYTCFESFGITLATFLRFTPNSQPPLLFFQAVASRGRSRQKGTPARQRRQATVQVSGDIATTWMLQPSRVNRVFTPPVVLATTSLSATTLPPSKPSAKPTQRNVYQAGAE